MAECARQLVLEPYLLLLNDVRSSANYVRSLKIFFNSFLALINQLQSCFVLCLSSSVCLTRFTLLTFVYCAFDMIQLKRYILFIIILLHFNFQFFRLVCLSPPDLGSAGQVLLIQNVTRFCRDTYVCVADNGVPPPVRRPISVTIQCKYRPLSGDQSASLFNVSTTPCPATNQCHYSM